MRSFRIPLTLVSAGLCGLALLVQPAWPLALVAPALFFFVLLSHQYPPSARVVALHGGLFGFVYYLFVYGSLASTYPLSFAGVEGTALSLLLVAVIWVPCAFVVGLPFMVFGSAVVLFARHVREPLIFGVFIIAAWVVSEMGSTFLFSVLSLGNSVGLSLDFTIGSIGNALGHGPSVLLLPARVGGVWLLSACALIPSVAVALLLRGKREERPVSHAVLAIAVLVAAGCLLIGVAWWDTSRALSSTSWRKDMHIVAISTNTPASLKFSADDVAAYRERLSETLEAAGIIGPDADLFVFPEGARIREYEPSYQELFSRYLPKDALVVDSGFRHVDTGPARLESRGFRVGGGVEGAIGKQLLFPLGEYTPFVAEYIGGMIAPDLIQNLKRYRTYATSDNLHLPRAGEVLVGTRLCSEIFSPRLYRELAGAGAGVLIDISSLAMFHGSPVLLGQMRAAARIRAVEVGLPILAVFNVGEPFAYDCRGHEIAPQGIEGAIRVYTFRNGFSCPRAL